MLVRLGHCLLLFALLASLNLHWVLVQAVAWTQMLVDYESQTGSLSDAVDMTFNGQNPCNLCEFVEQVLPTSDIEQKKINEVDSKITLLPCNLKLVNVLTPFNKGLIISISESFYVEQIEALDPPPPRISIA